MIRYASIVGESIVDGKGIRVAAFLQGCHRDCRGCHNPALQPPDRGIGVTVEEFVHLVMGQVTPLHQGITFSGGEPLLQAGPLARGIFLMRERRPLLDFWVYTGYTIEEVLEVEGGNGPIQGLLSLVDILVDGPFVLEKRSPSLPFRGSYNQRIIDVPRTLEARRPVELEL